jgi:hypothetical protein
MWNRSRIQHLENNKMKGLILSHLRQENLRQENTTELNHHPLCTIFHKIPTEEAQEIGILNQKQPQMCTYQCRSMNQQGNSSPSKTNSITNDLINSKVKEIANIEF